jgi:hypothetical protein
MQPDRAGTDVPSPTEQNRPPYRRVRYGRVAGSRHLRLVSSPEDSHSPVPPSATVRDMTAALLEEAATHSPSWARNAESLAARLEDETVTRHATVIMVGQSPDILHQLSLLIRSANVTTDGSDDPEDRVTPDVQILGRGDISGVAAVTKELKNREFFVELEDEI